MSAQSLKHIPKVHLPAATYEASLNESARELLNKDVAAGAVAAGADNIMPAGSIPMAASRTQAVSSPPPAASAMAAAVAPIIQIPDEVIGSLPSESALDQAMVASLRQMQQQAKQQLGGNKPPLQSADTKLIVNGRSVFIPASVRDVPNTLITYTPAEALQRYFIFTSRLTDAESDKLADIGHRSNGKPLMWLSSKIYYVLAIQHWLPQKDSAPEAFNVEDANPNSYSYKLIMETFGPECGAQILVAAERSNIGVLELITQICRKLLERDARIVDTAAKSQTVATWKRSQLSAPSPSLSSQATP